MYERMYVCKVLLDGRGATPFLVCWCQVLYTRLIPTFCLILATLSFTAISKRVPSPFISPVAKLTCTAGKRHIEYDPHNHSSSWPHGVQKAGACVDQHTLSSMSQNHTTAGLQVSCHFIYYGNSISYKIHAPLVPGFLLTTILTFWHS